MIKIIIQIIIRIYILYYLIYYFILLSKKIYTVILNRLEDNDCLIDPITEELQVNKEDNCIQHNVDNRKEEISKRIRDMISINKFLQKKNESNVNIDKASNNKKVICLHLYVPDNIVEEDIQITKEGNVNIKNKLCLELRSYNKKAIVLLCNNSSDHNISSTFLDLYNKITEYDIYLISKEDISKEDIDKYTNINFISVDENDCNKNGFTKVGDILMEKALYYFTHVKSNYKQIWIVENNTYIDSEKVFSNIDMKYNNSDLLSQSNNIVNKINPTQYIFQSNIQCIRISNKLLDIINKYAKKNKELFNRKYLFNTLALKNNCIIDLPEELCTIQPSMKWNNNNIVNINNIYFPYEY